MGFFNQKGTVKAVILFPRFDVAHILQQCRATIRSKARFWHPPLRISLTSAQRRLHSLSGVFCGRSHEGAPDKCNSLHLGIARVIYKAYINSRL